MRVLVNHGSDDKIHLGSLAYILKQMHISAISTSVDLTIGELLDKAKKANCDAILLCNENTLRYCVPGTNPTADKWRGSRLNFSMPVIVINKLAHIHTVPYGDWLLRKDLEKLQKTSLPALTFTHTVLKGIDSFKDAFSVLKNSIALAHDIETRTYPPAKGSLEAGETVITCAAWTAIAPNGILSTYVLPLIDFDTPHWNTAVEYETALYFLKEANALPQPKIMHNGMYDATHCIRYHAEPLNFSYDTMGMAHAEFSELPKTLDFVASYQLYDYIYWKDDAEDAAKTKDINKYWAYNGKDTWHTARIAIEQLRNAPAYARKNYAETFPLIYPSLYCNFEGLRIDKEEREKKRAASVKQYDKAKQRLQTMFANKDFNPGSWQQVQHYVYKVFGAKEPKIGKSKSFTDEKNLKAVGEQHPLLARITSEILDYREASKAIGTYYDFLQYKGLLLWALNPFGTESGRMACSSSSMWCGTQVQNIPGYAKSMLVADDGYELFEADNKQSEGRTTAYCAKEYTLVAALEQADKDFYKTLGTLFFNIPYEEVSDFFRNKVLKRIVHGTNYVMGAGTFIENIGVRILFTTATTLGIEIVPIKKANNPKQMTIKEFAASLLECYHKPFPRIREWYKEIRQEVSNTGYLVSPLGHTRRFFGDITKQHSIFRSAVAHQPQNLSVAILNKGFKRVYNELVIPGNGDIRIKAQIHDSIFGQWRIGLRDYYAPKILECMDNPVIVHGRILRIPVDIKYGHNWAEADELNPHGTHKYKGH